MYPSPGGYLKFLVNFQGHNAFLGVNAPWPLILQMLGQLRMSSICGDAFSTWADSLWGEVIEHGWRFRKYSRQNCNQNWPIQYCMHLTSLNIRALMCLWVYVLCDVVCVGVFVGIGSEPDCFDADLSWKLFFYWEILRASLIDNCTESNGPRHMNEAKPCWLTSDVAMQE